MTFNSPGFFILRTPLLPLENYPKSDLQSLFLNKVFKEGLYLASPNLFNEVEKYLNCSLDGKEREKLELSLYRYYLRSCYRCTPFGMFAGISLGAIAGQSTMQLAPTLQYRKNTRLDTHFLASFVQHLLQDEKVRESIRWFANNSLYTVGNKLRFIEYRIDKEVRTHHLVKVDGSEHVQSILSKARNGATINELANLLVTNEIKFEEAVSFVNEMIAACLLVSELDSLVTGAEYHTQLLEKLKDIPASQRYLKKLHAVVAALQKTDQNEVGVSTKYYDQVITDIKKWQIDFDSGKLFQCDMVKPAIRCVINKKVTDELSQSIRMLNRATTHSEQTNLKVFKEAFIKHYEEQEIPLLEVLDSEAGIGYPVNTHVSSDNSPLLANLFVKEENHLQLNNHQSNTWSKFLLTKLQEAIRRNSCEIEISEAEIQTILKDEKNDESLLPDSVYSLGSVLAPSGEELDKGNFLVYHEVTAGPSAINLLGRFCHMSNELTDLASEALRKEEEARPECIFAEILHIPQARLGNILMRPVLREYEIPILTRASVDEDHTIELNDLMVSIRNGRIFLRSKRLNKEVIPRLTTAHNFSMNPVPHYHFLCDLQFQGIKGGLSWNWGVLNEFPFLPRVRYGKTILSKARWILNLSNLSTKKDIKDSEIVELVTTHFTENGIPVNVTITQGDNQLPINIRNATCLKILVQDLKKYKSLILQECLFNDNNLVVTGPEGAFTNEIIIPWCKQIDVKQSERTNVDVKQAKEINLQQRSFLPGSEWHYAKIYCGVKTADLILAEVIKPLTEKLLEEGIISKFFFIRYYDPDHHLRIRFKGEGNFYAEVTNRLNKSLTPFLQANLVSNVQTEIYKREIERYGFENMDNSETIFFVDSIAVLNILSLLEGDEGDHFRWQFAIKGVNDLLDAFKFNNSMKKDLMGWLSMNFAKEFNADNQESKKQLSAKYREYRSVIELMFKDILSEKHEFYLVWQFFKTRKESLSVYAAEIYWLSRKNKLSVGLNDLVASYIHMFLNRFLRSKQRMQEMVIYDLLHQHYKSLLARESKNIKVIQTEQVS
ncbi:MAG: lantibiotic dehydratase [Cyclobacteriaceae bacterium]|nr:MAG: lantibiotic dehydratase [Cyclobacteriaceae bacterium]